MTLRELKEALTKIGFRTANMGPLDRGNLCDWYAYRASKLPARECETNEGKPAQIVIKPAFIRLPGLDYKNCEIELTGEVDEVWFKLMAYSIPYDEVVERLPKIEASLVRAWNALKE